MMLNETPFESVAAAHGICVKTLRRRCDRLKLAYQRYGKRYAFTPAQLLAYQQICRVLWGSGAAKSVQMWTETGEFSG